MSDARGMKAMSDWIDIKQWGECQRMAHPGIVFEIRNGDGQIMFSNCTVTVPIAPFDWKSAPVKFRAIAELPPRHSNPIPKPKE